MLDSSGTMSTPLILRRRLVFLLGALGLIGPASFDSQSAERPRKIALIAGSITGHPKETHEYEKNVILLKHLLDTSLDLHGKVKVEAYFKGWPEDPTTLDDADTIFLTSDGCDRRETDHPFYVEDRLRVIERQMKRGCGLVQFHWSTFNPARFHDQITEWAGGYFDYETGAASNKWHSAIQTWQATTAPGTPGHPVLRGVKPFTTQEEYYYRIRFRESDSRLKPIALTRPPNETNDFAVGWAVDRADGGRGFGFTGGHFYQNWWNADFRKLVLNAVVWTAKLDVPERGVQSEPFERFKVLILTGNNHPAHDWRATTAALILAIEQDPRAIVHVSENVEDLATDKINGYDLLVLNYCNWERPGLSAVAKTNFVRYLQNGGGLAIIHFANGAWHASLPNAKPEEAWPDYVGRICRRVWEHRQPNPSGHDAYGPFRVEIAGVKHPIIDGLQSFDTLDELYYRQAGELSVEPLAFALSKDTKQREPMAWAYDWDKGRVFQTLLGHADDSIRKAAALIRRGSVWAARRNPISFDPPVELTEGALFRSGNAWTPQESAKRAAGVSPADPDTASGAGGPKTSRPNDASTAGTPAISGREPGAQQEKDWVDNRWSQTDVGQFLASTLRVPDGTVAKALSIRIGDLDEAAVCYDTQTLNLRAAWTGGFLKFDPARFGLINPPRINGDIQLANTYGSAWVGGAARFEGLHRHGKRVVLQYRVNDTVVRESPWYVTTNGLNLFVRAFEVGPSGVPLKLLIQAPAGTMRTAHVFDPGVVAENRDASVTITFPPRSSKVCGKVFLWKRATESERIVARTIDAISRREDLEALSSAGPARWHPAIETIGHVTPDSAPLVIDTLTVPYNNPWKALMFLSGVDFTSDGAAYVSSIHGDVWKVTGIDDHLSKLTWQRFATGLFQPLGLKVVKDKVFVLGRDRITRLHDENGDGEADYYESFCNLIETSPEGHDYVTSLETDAAGNFYYVDPRGVHRVAADGRTKETLATGFRNPNGLGASPDGNIVTVAPQQGEWTPSSAIIEAKRGGYYGYGGPKATSERPLGYDPPLCWLPHSVDNSGASQIWVPSAQWGPLGGQMLHLSWGRCRMMLVLRDVVGSTAQGAAAPLPGRFLSGPMRGGFSPRDGHLYVVGSTGWQTSGLNDGSFQRVRYTEKPLRIPVAWRTHRNGLALTFAEPLDRDTAQDPGSYDLQEWNYRYAAPYGSKDWSVANPDKEGHDTLNVKTAHLAGDSRTVFLEISNLRPVMQLQIQYSLASSEGAPVRGRLFGTINQPGPAFNIATQ
jgi:type 1 glutamine amidotransferase